ncbi:unnamed protein product [Lactuca saligna]|uniref:DUF4283 domain-containing protein n=1 Tax=Lactuca saligna TaxID=75948 RepID=A0AA35YBY6_LACSI|nr:unnamed protein product [Lactuca saligna]
MGVRNVDSMDKELREVWFGFYKLFASVPRFPKPYYVTARHAVPFKIEKPSIQVNSYASVVKGSSGDNRSKELMTNVVEFSSGDFVMEKKKLVCLVKARDYGTLPNLRMLSFDEGFKSATWVVYGSCLSSKQKKLVKISYLVMHAIDHWVLDKRPWGRNFIPLDTIVWVDIEGIPLRAWSKTSFRKIFEKWGTIVQIDDELSEDIYKKREAPCWAPSFSYGFNHNDNNDVPIQDLSEDGGSNDSLCEKCEDEEHSPDPFNIYDTLHKLDKENLKARKSGIAKKDINQGYFRNSTYENSKYLAEKAANSSVHTLVSQHVELCFSQPTDVFRL